MWGWEGSGVNMVHGCGCIFCSGFVSVALCNVT